MTPGQRAVIGTGLLGTFLTVTGAFSLPEGAGALSVGMTMLAETGTLALIEFGFGGDTSSIPSPTDWPLWYSFCKEFWAAARANP